MPETLCRNPSFSSSPADPWVHHQYAFVALYVCKDGIPAESKRVCAILAWRECWGVSEVLSKSDKQYSHDGGSLSRHFQCLAVLLLPVGVCGQWLPVKSVQRLPETYAHSSSSSSSSSCSSSYVYYYYDYYDYDDDDYYYY